MIEMFNIKKQKRKIRCHFIRFSIINVILIDIDENEKM